MEGCIRLHAQSFISSHCNINRLPSFPSYTAPAHRGALIFRGSLLPGQSHLTLVVRYLIDLMLETRNV